MIYRWFGWVLALSGAIGFLQAGAGEEVRLEQLVSGLSQPVLVTHAGDGTGRLFVLEQQGRIRIVEDDVLRPQAFLDITAKVRSGGERGLLGLAFHPAFAQNRRFFVNYTRIGEDGLETVVAEFKSSPADPDRADPSERILLSFEQPFSNHNGGDLAFGPDGFLYVATGDGGSGGDPNNAGQSLDTLLGKILRIDVDGAMPYEVPGDNPFVSSPGALPEIWAYGLRNPWRFSFDRETGRLFAGDVGQNTWEEIDIIVRGGNYGWRVMEGPACFIPQVGCEMGGLILPIHSYGRTFGRSVTGGYVYRGPSSQLRQGRYIFADFVFGTIWELLETPSGWQRETLINSGRAVSSFGEDEEGNLYVVDYSGSIQRLVLQDPAPDLGLSGELVGDVAIGGHPFSVDFQVSNDGDLVSQDPLSLVVTLPQGLLLLKAQGSDWECVDQDPDLNCNRESPIQPGSSAALQLKAIPGPDVGAEAQVTARLESASGVDPQRAETVVELPVVAGGAVPRTFAQLALGGEFECVLLVGNAGSTAWQGAATLWQGNQQPWENDWLLNGEDRSGTNQFEILIEPQGSRKFVLSGDEVAREGYLKIEGTQGAETAQLSTSFFYQLKSEAALLDSTGTPAPKPEAVYKFPVEKLVRGDTGFAYAPFLDTGPFEITLTLYDTEGNQMGQSTRNFEGHSAEFFSETFDVSDGFVGMLELRSASRIFLTILRLELSGEAFQLTAVPAESPD